MPPTPPPEPEPSGGRTWPTDLLGAALERAVGVARRDASTRGAPAPPTALRPVIGFTKKLPTRALRTVATVLEADDAFRSRVADGADEVALGRASWLYLARPDGWYEELSLLADQAAEEQRDTAAARSELDARRRAEQLGESVERLRSDLVDATDATAAAEAVAARERAERLAVAAERDALERRVEQLEGERAAAVRQLKAVEATSTTRLEDLRSERRLAEELREQVRSLELQLTPDAADADPGAGAAPIAAAGTRTDELPRRSAWDDADPATVAEAVARAARCADALADALAAAAEELSPRPPAEVDVPASPERPSSPARRQGRPSRRVPLRLHSGVHDGTPDGLSQLLGHGELVAIVDGYNVTMEGWPALDQYGQRSSLVSAMGALQARVPAALHVVFDGDDDGRRPSVGAPLPVRVHFSPRDVEADDVILEMVAGLATDTPVLVVSSDRRVGEGARRLGANVARSSVLLELLRG